MDLIQTIISVGCPALLGLIAYVMRTEKESILERLNKLEAKTELHVTKTELREILNDNLVPIKEDVVEIKDILRRILLNGKN